MINITAKSANEAWRNTFMALYADGGVTDNKKYYRDEPTLIEITNPTVTLADDKFPMSQKDLDVINTYIYSGENEEAVVHEWTKLYHHRAFDQPNSQIEYMIENLRSTDPVGETQISMWDKNKDQYQKVSPCTQIIWARIKHGSLELHVHAHSSDAYKKLLMNILEFISLQHHIARRLDIPVGKYIHFIDSCHLHAKDKVEIDKLSSEF